MRAPRRHDRQRRCLESANGRRRHLLVGIPHRSAGDRWRQRTCRRHRRTVWSVTDARWRTVWTLSPDRIARGPTCLPNCQFARPSSGASSAYWPSTQRVNPSADERGVDTAVETFVLGAVVADQRCHEPRAVPVAQRHAVVDRVDHHERQLRRALPLPLGGQSRLVERRRSCFSMHAIGSLDVHDRLETLPARSPHFLPPRATVRKRLVRPAAASSASSQRPRAPVRRPTHAPRHTR